MGSDSPNGMRALAMLLSAVTPASGFHISTPARLGRSIDGANGRRGAPQLSEVRVKPPEALKVGEPPAIGSASTPGLLVLGLNPAWQTILRLRDLDLGQVNRAEAALPGTGGKGQNAAKAAAFLMKASREEGTVDTEFGVTVAQFLGGATGQQIQAHLNALDIASISAPTSAATRQTITLLDYSSDSSEPTVSELITPSEPFQADAVADLQAKLLAEAPKHKGVLLMGTWPSGVTSEVYAATAKAKSDGATVLMDAFNPTADVSAILAQGAVDIYKVNAYEICTIMGAEGLKEGEVTADQVKDAISRAFDKFSSVSHFAVTDGASGAFLFSREPRGAVRYEIPKVSCLNPIGAGDTVAGVTMAAYCSGLAPNLQDAMLLGLAAASAKVQNESEGGIFDMATMKVMKELITCTPIEW